MNDKELRELKRFDWSGHLTPDNIEDIVAAIRELLEGKRYTFVAVNRDYRAMRPEVRTGQRVKEREDWPVWRDGKHAGFNVGDSYGVWGLSCTENRGNNPYLVFTRYDQIFIKHKNGYGDTLNWVIALERDES